MAFVGVDESRRPVVTFTVAAVDPTDEQLETFFADFVRVLEKPGRRVFLLFDLTGAVAVSKAKLSKIGDFLKGHRELLGTRVRRTAIVVTNPLVKACIHVVFFVYAPERPWDTFAAVRRAGQWFAKPIPEDPPSRPGSAEKCG